MVTDYLVAGAGLFGSVVAERLATQRGRKVLLIDRRNHIGGNCFSEIDRSTGIEYHLYGTHIFHTSDPTVWKYVSGFTRLNRYRHRAKARYRDRVYPFPINLDTINAFYSTRLTPSDVESFLKEKSGLDSGTPQSNFEQKAVSTVGRDLYNAFIKGYTKKHWARDPRELPAEIFERLPVYFDNSRGYYRARWEGVPIKGYKQLFERLLSHENIQVETGVSFETIQDEVEVRHKIIYTGPIDRYFDYSLGRLEWRSLRFSTSVLKTEDFQSTAIMNYPEDHIPYTRVHEPKHLHPERRHVLLRENTFIMHEYPCQNESEPYYPIRTEKNLKLLSRYQDMANTEAPNVVFGGRLGTYAYLDMDQSIAAALSCARKLE